MWLDDVANRAHEALQATLVDQSARLYLGDRGVTDAQIQRHRIGWWETAPQVTNCTPEFWEWSRKYGYGGRLVFPLTDPFGTVTGMQLRGIKEGDRYQNFGIAPRELYPMTFGLNVALPEMFSRERVVLVEGVFDYFAVQPYAPDVLCTLTANVTLAIRRLLSRYVSLAICLYDMDKAGRRGAYRLAGLEVPPEYRQDEDTTRQKPRVPPCSVRLPTYSEHDPSDLAKVGKFAELQRLVSA